jgi:RNA polymerase sigma-70 factor (sigma-E family)
VDGVTATAGFVVADGGVLDLDLERAYVEHHAQALRWATALMADPHAGADVVQEAFLRIFSKVRPLRRPDAFAPYLRRTITRVAASRWRSERRAEARTERAFRLQGPPPDDEHDGGPGASAVDPRLLAAVRRLPSRQRSVVVLRFWLDWSEREIADALGCRPGTVKSLSSRALDALRADLEARL